MKLAYSHGESRYPIAVDATQTKQYAWFYYFEQIKILINYFEPIRYSAVNQALCLVFATIIGKAMQYEIYYAAGCGVKPSVYPCFTFYYGTLVFKLQV